MAKVSIKSQPWHRRLDEGPKAHELLMVFINMAGGRTVKGVADQTGRKPELCYTLSAKYDWSLRAAAYDQWMLNIQEESISKQLQRDGLIYAHKRSIFRDKEYTLATKLMDQAMEMLATPLFVDTITKTITIKTLEHPEGEQVPVEIIRQPVKWTKRDALAQAKVSIEIMRLHLEMETSRASLTVDLKDPAVRLNMARKSLEKWRKDIDQLVDVQMQQNPNLDRNLVTIAILEQLPNWASADWQLTPEQIPLLTEGDDALPLSLGDVLVPVFVSFG